MVESRDELIMEFTNKYGYNHSNEDGDDEDEDDDDGGEAAAPPAVVPPLTPVPPVVKDEAHVEMILEQEAPRRGRISIMSKANTGSNSNEYYKAIQRLR
jgi:hypothetical protein